MNPFTQEDETKIITFIHYRGEFQRLNIPTLAPPICIIACETDIKARVIEYLFNKYELTEEMKRSPLENPTLYLPLLQQRTINILIIPIVSQHHFRSFNKFKVPVDVVFNWNRLKQFFTHSKFWHQTLKFMTKNTLLWTPSKSICDMSPNVVANTLYYQTENHITIIKHWTENLSSDLTLLITEFSAQILIDV